MSFRGRAEQLFLERITSLRALEVEFLNKKYADDIEPLIKELYRQQANNCERTYHELEQMYRTLYNKPTWNFHRDIVCITQLKGKSRHIDIETLRLPIEDAPYLTEKLE